MLYCYKFVSSFQLQFADFDGNSIVPIYTIKTFLVREDGEIFEAQYSSTTNTFTYLKTENKDLCNV